MGFLFISPQGAKTATTVRNGPNDHFIIRKPGTNLQFESPSRPENVEITAQRSRNPSQETQLSSIPIVTTEILLPLWPRRVFCGSINRGWPNTEIFDGTTASGSPDAHLGVLDCELILDLAND